MTTTHRLYRTQLMSGFSVTWDLWNLTQNLYTHLPITESGPRKIEWNVVVHIWPRKIVWSRTVGACDLEIQKPAERDWFRRWQQTSTSVTLYSAYTPSRWDISDAHGEGVGGCMCFIWRLLVAWSALCPYRPVYANAAFNNIHLVSHSNNFKALH